MLFATKINLNVEQCILCGQYILPDRFLKNSGYLVEHKIFLTSESQFSSKRCFQKSKNTEVWLNLTLKWQHCDAFCLKIQPSALHLKLSIYIG